MIAEVEISSPLELPLQLKPTIKIMRKDYKYIRGQRKQLDF